MALNDNLSLPAAQAGLSPAKPASAWGFGSWVVVGTTTSKIFIDRVTVQNTVKPSIDTTHQILLEIGTGTTGAEQVILQVPFTIRRDTTVGYMLQAVHNFYLAELVEVAQGVQLSVRITDSSTGAQTYSGVKIGYKEGVQNQDLTVPVLSDGDTLHQPTVVPQAVTVTAPLLSDGDGLYEPTVTQVTNLTAPFINDSDTLYGHTIVPQGVSITAPVLNDSDSLHAPTIVPQAVSLSVPYLADSDSLFSQTVVPQAPTVAIPFLNEGDTLYEPTVTRGAVSVSVPLLVNNNTLFSPSVTVGAVSVGVPVLNDGDAVYAPSVNQAAAGQNLGLAFISSTGELFLPILTVGAVNIEAPLVGEGDTLYGPTLQAGAVSIESSLLENLSELFTPSISFGGGLKIYNGTWTNGTARAWRGAWVGQLRRWDGFEWLEV